MRYTDKIMRQSNYWYNDGLKRANFRDLSGAIISLRRSLQYCRKNIAARNLLGLVYYGRGEINEALVEWIISKNLRPRDNAANYYIKKVQNSPRDLNRINANIKKYNQCLLYCEQDAEDLAFIQIKKVVAAHPTFVKGYQLLALLSIQRGQYNRASQALKKAHKIDITDAITLYYMNELTELKARGKKSAEETSRSISYRDGNETIIQPTSATLKEEAGAITIVNIVIGIVIGAAVMAFLIQPAFSENEAMKNADAIRSYNEQMNAMEAEMNALQTELDTYRTTNDEAELSIVNASASQDNYELLIEVYGLLNEESTSNADMAELLLGVQVDLLGELGASWYESLADDIYPALCESLYDSATSIYNDSEDGSYTTSDCESMIDDLTQVLAMDTSYDDYEAAFILAEAYAGIESWEDAQTYYNLVISKSSNETLVEDATTALEKVEDRI